MAPSCCHCCLQLFELRCPTAVLGPGVRCGYMTASQICWLGHNLKQFSLLLCLFFFFFSPVLSNLGKCRGRAKSNKQKTTCQKMMHPNGLVVARYVTMQILLGGAGQMAQCFRALAALAEVLGSVLSTHLATHNHP